MLGLRLSSNQERRTIVMLSISASQQPDQSSYRKFEFAVESGRSNDFDLDRFYSAASVTSTLSAYIIK